MNRAIRDEARGRRAADHVRAIGGSAMDQAMAAIEASFSQASVINSHKARVEHWLCLSYGHPEVRARFRSLTDWFVRENMSLDEACVAMADERPAMKRLPLVRAIYAEMHLILRFLRRKGRHADFADLIAAARRSVLLPEKERAA